MLLDLKSSKLKILFGIEKCICVTIENIESVANKNMNGGEREKEIEVVKRRAPFN